MASIGLPHAFLNRPSAKQCRSRSAPSLPGCIRVTRPSLSFGPHQRDQHVVVCATGGGGGGAVTPPTPTGGSGGDGGSGGNAKHPMQLWTFLFAGMLAVGGTIAYVKKGSAKSLGAGLSASLVLALCARSMAGASAVGAVRVAFGLTLVLGIVMVNRYTRSKKIMPAGLVAGSSLLMAAGYLMCGL
mmetsp:Transcript_16528/g.35756  ORF Transcript_16528/g.35756 Transcript_16528/m.35756 type:complete len:186 (-) Transcript_16528:880-1437(-)|eukprot:CAMPEP_0202889686 /NCGR_PEP_ID=MMETSP1392-20130828/278_1 /ASSEMBLY_ACC=CAM_ASM_000868 /TAXON_ID=225041 /ORGANISM="Chlamydomonas chlamydogama, Strain SAG 11-48b" /LENGTH=185 /DNA_ID=CAMNT_0049573075 /DNA_START=39 /DNA_END=596 /DNA_ORIENTATION=+